MFHGVWIVSNRTKADLLTFQSGPPGRDGLSTGIGVRFSPLTQPPV